jgi:hypothetical protein
MAAGETPKRLTNWVWLGPVFARMARTQAAAEGSQARAGGDVPKLDAGGLVHGREEFGSGFGVGFGQFGVCGVFVGRSRDSVGRRWLAGGVVASV